MDSKLETFENLMAGAYEKNRIGILCIDMDELFKEIENIKIDIKTLESEIEYAYWNIEVS